MNTLACNVRSGNAVYGDRLGLQDGEILLEVDFKWLMAGQGCLVDPDRMKRDPFYANACLEFALHSSCDSLRDCAASLQVELASLDCEYRCQG
jgi:hypothetical protein